MLEGMSNCVCVIIVCIFYLLTYEIIISLFSILTDLFGEKILFLGTKKINLSSWIKLYESCITFLK